MHTNTINTSSRKGEQRIQMEEIKDICFQDSRTWIARWKHWVQHNDEETKTKVRDYEHLEGQGHWEGLQVHRRNREQVRARAVSAALDSQEQHWSQRRRQSGASTLCGETVPDLELNIQPHCQQSVRDEVQTLPHMWDFKCLLPMCPFLRRIHQTGESLERCEGMTAMQWA